MEDQAGSSTASPARDDPRPDYGNRPVRNDKIKQSAQIIFEAFLGYNEEFRRISRRARSRFEKRQWKEGQQDTVERIDLYEQWINAALKQLHKSLGDDLEDKSIWAEIKTEYSHLIQPYLDSEFMKTFYSSITRRVFSTLGVDASVEYIALDIKPTAKVETPAPSHVLHYRGSTRFLFDELLGFYSFAVPYRNIDRSVRYIAAEVDAYWRSVAGDKPLRKVQVLEPVFYQSTRAYIVGHLEGGDLHVPMAIALQNTDNGLLVDTVLLSESEVSMLFSFTRSYFHADLSTVADAIVYLKTLMPRKPTSELYTVLGRAKQGKTERYRSFFHHLGESNDKLIQAPGEKGMVMAVFTLPSYDIVFKVIRDRFAYPKTTSPQEVKAKYSLVFKHDRAGRLVDAQEFRQLEFPLDRFAPELLDELLGEAAETCKIAGNDLLVDHCYVERQLTPLNLYLNNAPPEAKKLAVIDYGQSIRDLAATNIFPGDLLSKNFGVTRHGRVIFYDYDELCLITDCRFRDMPKADSYEDEMRAGAWFYVGEDDVFPEQFLTFLGLDEEGKRIFAEYHEELMSADWWRSIQTRLRNDEVIEIVPYSKLRPAVSLAAGTKNARV